MKNREKKKTTYSKGGFKRKKDGIYKKKLAK